MKLVYRGIHYDCVPGPALKVGPVFATGSYRGVPVVFRNSVAVRKPPKFDLMWRGICYRTGLASPPARPLPDRAPTASTIKAKSTV